MSPAHAARVATNPCSKPRRWRLWLPGMRLTQPHGADWFEQAGLTILFRKSVVSFPLRVLGCYSLVTAYLESETGIVIFRKGQSLLAHWWSAVCRGLGLRISIRRSGSEGVYRFPFTVHRFPASRWVRLQRLRARPDGLSCPLPARAIIIRLSWVVCCGRARRAEARCRRARATWYPSGGE